jgi:hypothetical protein
LSVTFAPEIDGATQGPVEEDGPSKVRSLSWLAEAAQANAPGDLRALSATAGHEALVIDLLWLGCPTMASRRPQAAPWGWCLANGEPAGKSLAPEMKCRGSTLHLFGREPVICTVSGLRPGTRSMT